MGMGMNTRAYLLLNLNIETKETQEILRISTNTWKRIALSPEENQIVLNGFGPEFRKIQGKKLFLRIVDLATKEYEQLAFTHSGEGNIAWQYVWLNDETVVLALYEQDEFLFADIGKGR